MHTTHEKDWFVGCLRDEALVRRLKNISLVITDVDGCLTDGTKTWSSDEIASKRFSFHDGIMIQAAQQAGIPVAFISGDTSPITRRRAAKLGIPDALCQLVNWKEKVPAMLKIQQDLGATPAQTLLFGDDLPELMMLSHVGLFASPQDAVWYITEKADLISPRNGGAGALRAVLDLLLFVQGHHPEQSLISQLIQ